MPPRPHPPHGRARGDRRLARFVDPARLSDALRTWVPDEHDRAFVVRCLLEEGPAHHRGSNWILLTLLAELVGPATPPTSELVPVPMRVPPHLQADQADPDFPLSIPRAALELLAPGDQDAQDAMIECLIDGPPQHALSNAATLCLLEAALRQKRQRAG